MGAGWTESEYQGTSSAVDCISVINSTVYTKANLHNNEISNNLNKWWDGIKSGEIEFVPSLPLIRDFCPAYIPKHMNVVSGYTSAGKSQYLAQVAADAAGVQKREVAIFTLEDSKEETMMSILGVVTGIHKRAQLLGELTEEQRDYINMSMSVINDWPLKIYDKVRTIGAICDIIAKTRPKLAIIDYIQKLKDGNKTIYENMSMSAITLFDLAQDTGTTLEIASQISASAAKDAQAPVIELKGAGEIAEAAHCVKRLRKGREEGKWNEVMLDIQKNKAFGKCGSIKCTFNETWTQIIPVEEAHQMHSIKLDNRRSNSD